MLGLGPGALPTDAAMIGIEPAEQRAALEEDTEVLMRLLLSDEPVSKETARYKLVDARCQLRPFTDPCFEIGDRRHRLAVRAAHRRPARACRCCRSAPRSSATPTCWRMHWDVAEERAAEFGTTVSPRRLAARRPDAHRRDPRAGAERRRVRPRRLVRLPPAHGRRAAVPPARRHARGAHRLGQRERRRRHRHAGGRGQQDRRAVQAVQRRLRLLPDDGPRVGPARTPSPATTSCSPST